MIFEFKDMIAILALVISIINLYLYFFDIKPTLKAGFYLSEIVAEGDDELSIARVFSIDIVNHSSRRIKVANISVEWMKSRWFSFRKRRESYPDFQKDKSSISSFWIEPWGDASFIVEEESFTTWLWERTHYSKDLWIRIVVTDALGNRYNSQILKT